MMSSTNSVRVMTAMPAMAPPRPSDPVSPMNTSAGKVLYQRKPRQAPPTQPATTMRSVMPGSLALRPMMKAMPASATSTIAEAPAARPSRPSVRFTALENPASVRKMSA